MKSDDKDVFIDKVAALSVALFREHEDEVIELTQRIWMLEDKLFSMGAMNIAPCFCCGYNGAGYYQPNTHKCAERHHKLWKSA